MIALLCPTRKRPNGCQRMIESAVKTADHFSVYLAYDESEVESYNWASGNSLLLPDGMPTAHKWNMLAQIALKDKNAKLFMLASDDMEFHTPLWDKAILEHYNALKNKIHVYALQDSRDENGTPHIIVTREWIEEMGYFVPPIFLHWFIDSWTVEMAKASGCFTHMKDYLLVHNKPSDAGKPDETHSRIRDMGWHNRDKYVASTCLSWRLAEIAHLKYIMEELEDHVA